MSIVNYYMYSIRMMLYVLNLMGGVISALGVARTGVPHPFLPVRISDPLHTTVH